MVGTKKKREQYSTLFHFNIDPKWRRGGNERRIGGSSDGKGLFQRRVGDRRTWLLNRISPFIFPRGFQREG